jgi:Glucose-6-phosphate dehydrogenase subunit
MSEIFNALPGIPVPVGLIKKRLTQMWSDTAAAGGAAPQHDAAKATQVNFVVQFGLPTTVDDAREQFQTVVRFSRRYPCRVVVLCPMPDETTETEMLAKIYGECHLGKSKGDTRCCEFVMLNYPPSSRPFVENQVSICLSTDLPLYYWAHRFISSARISQFNFLLSRSKRVLLDSAITPADALTFPWPKPEAVRDLAHARLLPVRQTIGQFLSSYAPPTIIDGLNGVTLVHTPAVAAEARVLAKWLTVRLQACGAGDDIAVTLKENTDGASFELDFQYANAHRFHWCGDLEHGSGKFEADYGTGTTVLPTAVSLLTPEAALGEAMFF